MSSEFYNIPYKAPPRSENGQSMLDNVAQLQVGFGNRVLRSDRSGFWLGDAKFNNAPFRVDHEGNAIANSITVGGYIPTGGAAADVNSGATEIAGAKIVNLSITSTKIADNSISTPKLQANSVVADKIATNAIIAGKIAANAIESANIQAGQIKAANLDTGELITLSAQIKDAIITNAKIDSLSADKLTAGTINVGFSGRPGYIYMRRGGSQSSNDAYLRWEGGSQIWSDSSNYVGIKSTGERIYFYTGTSLYALFQRNAQAGFYAGINVSGGNSNFDGGVVRVESGTLRVDNYFNTDDGGKTKYFNNINMDQNNIDNVNNIYADAYLPNSDLRLKKSVTKLANSTEVISKLNPVAFKYKKDDKQRFGLIAQEVQEVLPEVVQLSDNGFYTVNYMDLIAHLISANQELSQRVSQLEKK